MAGIIYPNVMGTIAPLMQMEQAEKRNAFEMDRIRRADELDARDRETGQHFGAAVQGDKDAQAKVMANPKYALPLAQFLERADSNQRAKIKEGLELTGRTAAGILALPEDQQPAAYEAAYSNLTQMGHKLNLPPKWSPALKGQLQSFAVQVPEYLKMIGNEPQPMGGAPAPAGGGVSSNNIGNVRPNGQSVGFQQPATLEDGIRLAVNNVKAYPKAFNGGQPMSLVQIGQRWAPKGDGANDPLQWARNVASIGGLDPSQPLDFNDPMTAAKFARGVHGAEHGAGKVMPVEAYAQALTQGGAPPGLAQGSDMPAADGSGTPLPPQAPQSEVFEINSWLSKAMPGARPMGVKGKPVRDSQGLLMVQKPDGSVGWVDVPKPQQPPSGYQAAPGGLAPIPGGPADPARQRAERVPPGYRLAADGQSLEFIPGGPADPALAKKAQPMTEGQANAALYADRMRAADKIIAANQSEGQSAVGKGLEYVPGGNYLQSEGYQLYEQARRDFINAVLRRESGAVISDAEFANAEKQYFPRPGDKADVLKQKAENRRIALDGISRAAGSSYKPPAEAAPTGDAPKPGAPPASPGNASPIAEGATATNPATGERIIFSGGQWRPTR